MAAKFNYRAKDKNGELHAGVIEAADENSASTVIRRKGLVLISLTQSQTNNFTFFDQFFNSVGYSDIVNTTRQLATMINAGLVLSEAIDLLEEQQSNKTFQKALVEISEDIKGGMTFSAALGKHPNIFPPLYVNLVKSGETSGKLDVVLLKMADSLEKEREFRSRVRGAMIYPGVVITMMFAVGFIMMTFVIPKLVTLYQQSTIELPLPTKILIDISGFFVNEWWVVIILSVAGGLAFRKWLSTPGGALMFDKILLRLPVLGKVTSNVILTNFNRTFGLLISAGVPLLTAINIVGDVTTNLVYKQALREAYSGVEKGLPFSSLLSSNVFPKLISQMVKVGEETGKVDEIFLKLADYYEMEADNLVRNLTTAIEPIVIIILGLGVAFLVISIILPIYKLTTSY